jgi:magnesium transporter
MTLFHNPDFSPTVPDALSPLSTSPPTQPKQPSQPSQPSQPDSPRNAPSPIYIALVDYNSDRVTWHHQPDREIYHCCHDDRSVSWLDIQGDLDASVWSEIGEIYGLEAEAIETISLTQITIQRAKLEEYSDAILLVFRMVACDGDRFRAQPVSLTIGPQWLISVQEQTDYDCFEPVRDRLRKQRHSICHRGVDYLAYALIDATIDSFFPVLEHYGERIAALEQEIITAPHPATLQTIYQLRRELLELRRAVWPQRHVVNLLSRGGGEPIVGDMARAMLRDSYDRLMQVLETIETYRELSSGLMDIYLSALGQKTNEVMKTLTVISTIFIPLTFVAGIYGMNFNTERSPFNMPELNWFWGYPFCLAVMATIAGGSIFFFWRRGWFRDFSDLHDDP